ncbi:hypothetical protein LZ30DRAFT_462632 [Colletotrichum cereale]|nr:hypothetical protein LZ30DRAFT_462632 [Colletotrichum cereale]
MAQQGGAYRAPPGEGAAIGETKPAPPTPGRDENEKPGDGDWEVVSKPDDGLSSGRKGFFSSFDLQLGWGSWKTSVLSWDVSVRTEHTHLPGSSQNKEKGREDDQRVETGTA